MNTMLFHKPNTLPTAGTIFVFGSDEKGSHGKGAAKIARTNFRAEYGVSRGRTGNAYAILIKDRQLKPLDLPAIEADVAEFITYAVANPKLKFFLDRVACGSEGYTDAQIAPLFASSPGSCSLPEEWKPIIDGLPSYAKVFAPAA